MNNTVLKKSPTMSLNEARSVVWPFRDIKGQAIGPLLDKGFLSYKDLIYAVQAAWDVNVREAARTILLHWLSQEQLEPENKSGPLNIVSAERRSFAERRQLQIAMLMGSILGLIAAPLPFLFWLWSNRPTPTGREQSFTELTSNVSGIIALAVVLTIMIAIAIGISYVSGKILDRLLFNRLQKQLQLHRKGQLGEERVLNVMFGVLDGKWWLFRNLEMPGRRIGDLDMVLVGPHGVWSFVVKAYCGNYRNVGDQ